MVMEDARPAWIRSGVCHRHAQWMDSRGLNDAGLFSAYELKTLIANNLPFGDEPAELADFENYMAYKSATAPSQKLFVSFYKTDLTGGTYPMTIWKSFMQAVHEGLEIKEFPEYTEYADNSVKTDTLPDNIIDNGDNSRQESTAAIEDIQNALGDKSYNGAGGDGNAASSAGGDGNATGAVSGDGNASGHHGGDGNASGTVGGDKNAGALGGDGNASGSVGGDKKAGTVGGDTNAPGSSRGDSDAAGTAGGDVNAGAGTSSGGDTNAGYTAGGDADVGAGTTSGSDTNAGYMVGGDADVKLP